LRAIRRRKKRFRSDVAKARVASEAFEGIDSVADMTSSLVGSQPEISLHYNIKFRKKQAKFLKAV